MTIHLITYDTNPNGQACGMALVPTFLGIDQKLVSASVAQIKKNIFLNYYLNFEIILSVKSKFQVMSNFAICSCHHFKKLKS